MKTGLKKGRMEMKTTEQIKEIIQGIIDDSRSPAAIPGREGIMDMNELKKLSPEELDAMPVVNPVEHFVCIHGHKHSDAKAAELCGSRESFGIIVTREGKILKPFTEWEAVDMLRELRSKGDRVASLNRRNPTNETPIEWEKRHGVEGATPEESKAELSRIAATLGRKGGSSKSEAKQAAVRENGRKGGRPRKVDPSDEEALFVALRNAYAKNFTNGKSDECFLLWVEGKLTI